MDFNRNELTGPIPPELGNLENLEELHLDNNTLTGQIPAELGNLSKLEQLHLDNNMLTGEIPAELAGLSNLVLFYVERNALTGCIPAALHDVDENDLEKLGLATCVARTGRVKLNCRPGAAPPRRGRSFLRLVAGLSGGPVSP